MSELHKCELKHKSMSEISFQETVDERIEEWPHSWPDGDITYRLNNFTTDIPKEEWQTRAVTVALRAWQLKVSKIKFRRERNPDVSVDFDVSFEKLDHFDGKRGVFAQMWEQGVVLKHHANAALLRGHVHLLAANNLSTNSYVAAN